MFSANQRTGQGRQGVLAPVAHRDPFLCLWLEAAVEEGTFIGSFMQVFGQYYECKVQHFLWE